MFLIIINILHNIIILITQVIYQGNLLIKYIAIYATTRAIKTSPILALNKFKNVEITPIPYIIYSSILLNFIIKLCKKTIKPILNNIDVKMLPRYGLESIVFIKERYNIM